MGVVCLAIVGKNVHISASIIHDTQQNNPLFVKVLGKAAEQPGTELQFHFICHTALDIFEERESSNRKTADMFLGMLYPTEVICCLEYAHFHQDYRVYGYITSTKIKFVCVVDELGQEVKDVDIKNIFKNIHSLYVDLACNPFHKAGEPIKSAKFAAAVESSVKRLFLPPLGGK